MGGPHAWFTQFAAVRDRCVGARAVLIRGPAGSGKSRLALALIEAAHIGAIPFARLVADDRVMLEGHAMGGCWRVRPTALAGLIEVRGLGIRRLAYEPVAVVGLVVDLAAADAQRLPRSGRPSRQTSPASGCRGSPLSPGTTRCHGRSHTGSRARTAGSTASGGKVTMAALRLSRLAAPRSSLFWRRVCRNATSARNSTDRALAHRTSDGQDDRPFRAVQPGRARGEFHDRSGSRHPRAARRGVPFGAGARGRSAAADRGRDHRPRRRRRAAPQGHHRGGQARRQRRRRRDPDRHVRRHALQSRHFGDEPAEGRGPRRHQPADAGQARQGPRRVPACRRRSPPPRMPGANTSPSPAACSPANERAHAADEPSAEPRPARARSCACSKSATRRACTRAPSAKFVQTVEQFDADVRVTPRQRRTVGGTSIMGLMMLARRARLAPSRSRPPARRPPRWSRRLAALVACRFTEESEWRRTRSRRLRELPRALRSATKFRYSRALSASSSMRSSHEGWMVTKAAVPSASWCGAPRTLLMVTVRPNRLRAAVAPERDDRRWLDDGALADRATICSARSRRRSAACAAGACRASRA